MARPLADAAQELRCRLHYWLAPRPAPAMPRRKLHDGRCLRSRQTSRLSKPLSVRHGQHALLKAQWCSRVAGGFAFLVGGVMALEQSVDLSRRLAADRRYQSHIKYASYTWHNDAGPFIIRDENLERRMGAKQRIYTVEFYIIPFLKWFKPISEGKGRVDAMRNATHLALSGLCRNTEAKS